MAFKASEKTILVVDDEVDLCEILQFDLEDTGYQTFSANHALQALEILQNHHIDLILSDIRMPGGDGVFLLDTVRQRDYQHPPMIFISGFADISVEEAYHKGVTAIFSKPLCSEQLLQHVEFVLKAPMERWQQRSDWSLKSAFKVHCTKLPESATTHFRPKLGRGGLFIPSADKLPRVGDLLQISCYLPEVDASLEGLTIARWVRNRQSRSHQARGIGLEFLELNDESIDRVTKFADRHKLIPYIPME